MFSRNTEIYRPRTNGSRLLPESLLAIGFCDVDAHFSAVAADFGNIHGLADDGQGMEFAGDFGAEVVTNFPRLRSLSSGSPMLPGRLCVVTSESSTYLAGHRECARSEHASAVLGNK